jgi:drug/metabolite transporter (DMT)-like permease
MNKDSIDEQDKRFAELSSSPYFDPLTTVVGAWFLLSEHPTPLFYLGAALIVIGVYIVDMRPRLQSV